MSDLNLCDTTHYVRWCANSSVTFVYKIQQDILLLIAFCTLTVGSTACLMIF